MNLKTLPCLLIAFLLAASKLTAQVPHLINYQGRLAVNGVNFDGAGQFKFALVSRDGATSHWSNDGTSTGGSEPADAVALSVAHGLYAVLLGDPALAHMTEVPPAAFASGDVWLRVWFNDGTNGFQQLKPDQRLAAVGYAMLAANVPAGAITADQLADHSVTVTKLGQGSVGADQLAPGAAAQNLQASGGLILSDQANAANLLAAGFVKIGSVNAAADGWRTIGNNVPPAARQYHTAVWTGTEMIIWGADQPSAYKAGAASDGGRYNPALDTWTAINTNNAPIRRLHHGAVWTGREMLVWGGSNGVADHDTGARYDPSTDSWRGMTTNNTPEARHDFGTVWTGHEMLVWGGRHQSTDLATGGRYNPDADTWTSFTNRNAPEARGFPAAVWTGDRLVVWGGQQYLSDTTILGLRTGGIYNPADDSWQRTATLNSPVPHVTPPSAVWTGQEMLVWSPGGVNNIQYKLGRFQPDSNTWRPSLSSALPAIDSSAALAWTGTELLVWGNRGTQSIGGRYAPLTDSWQPMRTNHGPSFLVGNSVIWTGDEMILWGGPPREIGAPQAVATPGARYDPGTDSWRAVAERPSARLDHAAVWTGSEMVVWGGSGGSSISLPSPVNDGGRYNPVTGLWQSTASVGAPVARQNHTAIWTGTEMIVWGGFGSATQFHQSALNSGGRYSPITDAWTATTTNGAPTARFAQTAIWTGSEMIVWGGRTGDSLVNYASASGGARYFPETDSWEEISNTDAPSSRFAHTAVWTGREMLIWGGFGTTNQTSLLHSLRSGGRYNFATHTWKPMTLTNAPFARHLHTAVWTGREMIVWGGSAGEPFGKGFFLDSGSRYDPANDYWTAITTSGAPSTRIEHTAVWNGSEMIIWGGRHGYGFFDADYVASGARFNPTTGGWTTLPIVGAPSGRARHTAVWTGEEMLIFGGTQRLHPPPDTLGIYSVTKPLYLYQKP